MMARKKGKGKERIKIKMQMQILEKVKTKTQIRKEEWIPAMEAKAGDTKNNSLSKILTIKSYL